MEGSALSFLKAEWKVGDTGSAHWASSFISLQLTGNFSYGSSLYSIIFYIMYMCVPYGRERSSLYSIIFYIMYMCVPYGRERSSLYSIIFYIMYMCVPYGRERSSLYSIIFYIMYMCVPYGRERCLFLVCLCLKTLIMCSKVLWY